jgi:hypothetical protein
MQTIPTRVAQVFWGLAIIAVDLRLGRFDVLPDFVGYILVALGTAGLVGWSKHFKTASVLSWALVPTTIVMALFQGSFVRLVWVLSMALDGGLIWFLLGGVMAFAGSRSRLEWVSWASLSRRAYLVGMAAGIFIGWIAPALPTLARILSSVTFFAMVLITAAILYLLFKVKGEAAAAGSETSGESTKTGNPFSAKPPEEVKKAA